VRNDPNNSEALYVRGVAMLYTGNTDGNLSRFSNLMYLGAVKHFRQALQGDPDNSKYRSQLKVIEIFINLI
jgi:hypothetical protein